jgi:arylsulfatase A-like enzyme
VTTSFVNPHDIAWWYRWSERFPAEARAPRVATALPPNFETPEELVARGKPALQRSLQDTAAASFGAVPFHGADGVRAWLGFMDLYVKLQREVDRQVGVVLDALASRPEVAANTVIVFSSDHGETAASHACAARAPAPTTRGSACR